MSELHEFEVQVYYEDTDHSGLVYHANYLKFFERAREHLLGVEELLRFARDGIGFVVHDLGVTYRLGARFGERLVVRSQASCHGRYRLRLRQEVFRRSDDRLLVSGVLDLVCVGPNGKLTALPAEVRLRFPVEPAETARETEQEGM
ncbi:MAG: thioesterase family protein [Polyangiaceae bacterium]|nr:thioesterase family protein [Polyangiaceae bacterium]